MASLSMLKKQKLAKQMNGNDDWVFKFPCPFLVFHWWVKYITQKDEWVLNIAGFCILKSYSISFFLPSLLNYSSTIHSFHQSRTLFFFIHFCQTHPSLHILGFLFFFFWRKFSVQECSDIYICVSFLLLSDSESISLFGLNRFQKKRSALFFF